VGRVPGRSASTSSVAQGQAGVFSRQARHRGRVVGDHVEELSRVPARNRNCCLLDDCSHPLFVDLLEQARGTVELAALGQAKRHKMENSASLLKPASTDGRPIGGRGFVRTAKALDRRSHRLRGSSGSRHKLRQRRPWGLYMTAYSPGAEFSELTEAPPHGPRVHARTGLAGGTRADRRHHPRDGQCRLFSGAHRA
jgi:hypothetical protein